MSLVVVVVFLVMLIWSDRSSWSANGLKFSSPNVVTHLPGFHGRLPFYLETGYVGVDDSDGVQLFYYFIKSENKKPEKDPLILWLTGGPGCSAFSGLVFEIGPLKFRSVKYNGSLPTLAYFPHSWSKVANIIFLDSPVETGFSFSSISPGYISGDVSWSKHAHNFLLKWFVIHPEFLDSPLYVAGDSYAGKVVPVVAADIAQGIEAGHEPSLNLKGYVLGNPSTGEEVDKNSEVLLARNLAIISNQLYEETTRSCKGEDHRSPKTSLCAEKLDSVKEFLSEINTAQILEPKCAVASPHHQKDNIMQGGRSLRQNPNSIEYLTPPPLPSANCRSYAYYLSYYWANDNTVRGALKVQEGTVPEWTRCNKVLLYEADINTNIIYHDYLTRKGYRAVIYSGDHDLVVPHLGTQAWINSLNSSIVDDWRSWSVGGQVAGYTRTYSNNITFATVKGAGHTAPEYKPKECLAMLGRWLSFEPL